MFCKRSVTQTRLLLGARSRSQFLNFYNTANYARQFASKDNFLSGSNANYIDHMYEQWKKDPKSVNASWQAYFATDDFQTAPTLGQTARDAQLDEILKLLKNGGAPSRSAASSDGTVNSEEAVALFQLCRAFMSHGHFCANLDPLDLKNHYGNVPSMAKKFRFPTEEVLHLLDYRTHGFSEADLDKTFRFKIPFNGAIAAKTNEWKLRDLIQAYKNTYQGNVGIEFMHI